MRIIYTDKNRKDIGYLPPSDIDIAYGASENDFQVNMSYSDACLEPNEFVYAEDSEVGGIVDEVNPDTKRNIVSYKGRTWHGILNSKVITPDSGEDYYSIAGEGHSVLSSLVSRHNLQSIFSVESEDSGIEVDYSFPRYCKLYDGIRLMLFSYGARLGIIFKNKKAVLSIKKITDYSIDEQWDNSQFKMKITKKYNPTNHLICLGSGELSKRHVLHLFTDWIGNIRPYTTSDNPMQDSDFILDESMQMIKGQDEVCEVYDYPSAQTAINYIKLQTKPANWQRRYIDYFKYSSDSYTNLEREYSDVYTGLVEEPDNWDKTYTSYYQLVDDKYVPLDSEGVEYTTYEEITKKPKKWNKNYSKFFYEWTDGIETEYRPIPGVSYEEPQMLEIEPTDWKKNYGNYYIEVVEKNYLYEFKKKRNGVWQKWEVEYSYKIKTFDNPDYKCKYLGPVESESRFVKISDYIKEYNKKLKEEPGTLIGGYTNPFANFRKSNFRPFYKMETKEKAPSFSKYRVLRQNTTKKPLSFRPNAFYEKSTKEIIPPFIAGKYYKEVEDHYSDLAEYGVKKLKEYWQAAKVEVSIDASELVEYYIGDKVGAVENITNTSVTASINKKIIKIKQNGKTTITYEVGGM